MAFTELSIGRHAQHTTAPVTTTPRTSQGAPASGASSAASSSTAPSFSAAFIAAAESVRSTAPGTTTAGSTAGTSAASTAPAAAATQTPADATDTSGGSPFGDNPWLTNPTGSGPDSSVTNYNPIYFATQQTAQIVAQMTGGTVVSLQALTPSPGSTFQQNEQNLMVQLPNGGLINPGLVADVYTHGWNTAFVNQQVANEISGAVPASTYS